MDKITIKRPWSKCPEDEDASLIFAIDNLSQVSDGYHTIAELYDHRITLFIALCKKMQGHVYQAGARYDNDKHDQMIVWRSTVHSDGKPAYAGWFLLCIGREKGKQISYHIPLSRWSETDFAETLDRSPEFDGHSSQDVLDRLKNL